MMQDGSMPPQGAQEDCGCDDAKGLGGGQGYNSGGNVVSTSATQGYPGAGQGYSGGAAVNAGPGPGQIVLSESEFQGLQLGAELNDGKMVLSEEQWTAMQNRGQA